MIKCIFLDVDGTLTDGSIILDSNGNEYDFAYGMNWKGVINDKRVKKYK